MSASAANPRQRSKIGDPTQASGDLRFAFLFDLQSMLRRFQEAHVRADYLSGKILRDGDRIGTLQSLDVFYKLFMPDWHHNVEERTCKFSTILAHVDLLLSASDNLLLLPVSHPYLSTCSYSFWVNFLKQLMTSEYWVSCAGNGISTDQGVTWQKAYNQVQASSGSELDYPISSEAFECRKTNCTSQVATFISDELKKGHDALLRLKQKYHDMENLLRQYCTSRSEGRTRQVKVEASQPTRIYYNSCWRGEVRSQKNCNWCGRVGHLEANCWIKKGVCRLCGTNSHSSTACSRYIPRFGEARTVPGRKRVKNTSQNVTSKVCSIFDSSALSPGSAMDGYSTLPSSGLSCESLEDSSHKWESVRLSSSMIGGRAIQDKKAQKDSLIFPRQSGVPKYVLDDSVVFPSEAKLVNDRRYYQLCALDDDHDSGEKCGIVLTAQEEIWDVSSIDDQDEQQLATRDNTCARKDAIASYWQWVAET